MQVTVSGFTFPGVENFGQYAVSGVWPDEAWCAEQEQYLYFGQSIEYTLVDGEQAWAPSVSASLDQYLSQHQTVSDHAESVAVQEGIWAILNGDIVLQGNPVSVQAMQLHNPSYQDLLIVGPRELAEPGGLPVVALGLVVCWWTAWLSTIGPTRVVLAITLLLCFLAFFD